MVSCEISSSLSPQLGLTRSSSPNTGRTQLKLKKYIKIQNYFVYFYLKLNKDSTILCLRFPKVSLMLRFYLSLVLLDPRLLILVLFILLNHLHQLQNWRQRRNLLKYTIIIVSFLIVADLAEKNSIHASSKKMVHLEKL